MTMVRYDQRFKELLTEFLEEFLELFFPMLAAQLDCSAAHFLDKETFTQPREGYRKELDLVVRVRSRTTGQEALIHGEIQAYRSGMSGRRMFDCNTMLRPRHNQSVWSIVLYLREGVGKVGFLTYQERFEGQVVHTFRYGGVNLAALNVVDYREAANALAGALLAFMQPGPLTPVEHKLVCYQHILRHGGTDVRREMLVDIVDTYLVLSASEEAEFRQILSAPENEEMEQVTFSWRREGVLIGRRESLLEVLRARFGEAVDTAVEEQVHAIRDERRLTRLLRDVVTAGSLADLGLDGTRPLS
jgi:hypothetical protein